MFDALWIIGQMAGLVGLIYGAWLVYTNRDLWREDERDPRTQPRSRHPPASRGQPPAQSSSRRTWHLPKAHG